MDSQNQKYWNQVTWRWCVGENRRAFCSCENSEAFTRPVEYHDVWISGIQCWRHMHWRCYSRQRLILVMQLRGGALRRSRTIHDWGWWCLIHRTSYIRPLRARHQCCSRRAAFPVVVTWATTLSCTSHTVCSLLQLNGLFRTHGVKWFLPNSVNNIMSTLEPQ